MALPATFVGEVRPTNGTINAGAFFNPGNANFPTDMTTDANTGNTASPVVSSASYNFAAGDTMVFVKSGANSIPGWYPIASVAGGKATLSADVGQAILYDATYQGGVKGANTVAGIATVGTPTSLTFGVDYSQQNAAGVAFTDLVQASTTTLTSALNPIGKNHVGNGLCIVSGTGTWTTGIYEVVSVSVVTATVDRSTGGTGGTAGTGSLGGARSGYTVGTNTLQSSLVAGHTIFIKKEAWNEAVSLTVSGAASLPISHFGYNAARGDNPTGANRPVNDRASAAGDAWTLGNIGSNDIRNVIMKSAGDAGFSPGGQPNRFVNCRSTANGGEGFEDNNGGIHYDLVNVELDTNTGPGAGQFFRGNSTGIYVHDNGSFGIGTNTLAPRLMFFIIEANSSHGISYGSLSDGPAAVLRNGTIDGNTGGSTDGINLGTPAITFSMLNCILSNNGRYGANSGNPLSLYADYNNYFGNATAARNNFPVGPHDTALDPQYTNAAGGDFSIGTNLKALGWPGLFPAGLSTGYLDIGAVQRQESGGGATGGGPLVTSGGAGLVVS